MKKNVNKIDDNKNKKTEQENAYDKSNDLIITTITITRKKLC